MDNKLFGYCIGSDVYIDINNRLIINVGVIRRDSRQVKSIVLRNTMLNLLLYFLAHANDNMIPLQNILEDVWDKHHLRSSKQRLWQVMQQLKFKMNQVGIPDDFIEKVDIKGYAVRGELVTPLFTR